MRVSAFTLALVAYLVGINADVACPALEWVVDLSELEWVESGEGDFNRQSRLSP
jgi:hypothetical protein